MFIIFCETGINASLNSPLMKQALFLTLLMLITPFVACTSLLETEQKNDILEPEIIDYNAAKIATNPLGWEWVT